MSDACFLFGIPYDQSSAITDWISAVSSFLTLLVAIWVGFKTYQISKYQSIQSDRKIIEEIYILYCEAIKSFSKDCNYPLESLQQLYKAQNLSRLYGCKEVEQFLTSKIENYNKGMFAHLKCYDMKGQARDSHNEKDIEVSNAIVRDLIESHQGDEEAALFLKFLKVKSFGN